VADEERAHRDGECHRGEPARQERQPAQGEPGELEAQQVADERGERRVVGEDADRHEDEQRECVYEIRIATTKNHAMTAA
jgi:hypothetical protein